MIRPESASPSVFITGASDGIGAALAKVYANRGWRLGLLARRGYALDSLARSLPTSAAIYVADVRDRASVTSAATDFIERFGPPDVVIANAGVSAGNLTGLEDDIAMCEWIFDVNVLGMIRTFQPFLGAMQERKRGVLVGVASVAAVRGLPGSGAYCASKSAMVTYLESLRVELRGSGVSVVTLSPGYVATSMTARNPYRMPFMLPADEAARQLALAVDARKPFAVVPWQMAIVARVLRLLPSCLFDRLFEGVERKPRRSAPPP